MRVFENGQTGGARTADEARGGMRTATTKRLKIEANEGKVDTKGVQIFLESQGDRGVLEGERWNYREVNLVFPTAERRCGQRGKTI